MRVDDVKVANSIGEMVRVVLTDGLDTKIIYDKSEGDRVI